MTIDFRQYQHTARYYCNQKLNDGRHPLIVMGGGTGKTKTSMLIIPDRISLKKRILVLVPQDLIFDQWINECSENKLNYGYINQEGVIGRNKDVYICMYQSLTNMLYQLPEKFIRSFDEIIIDEAHHASAESFRKIFDTFGHCLRMGLTASPYRMDNQPLGEFFTDLFVPIKNSEATKKGYLCGPAVILPDEYKDLVPEDPENIDVNEQKKNIHLKKIIGDMVGLYKEVFNGLPIIAPCSGYSHAVEIKKMYESAGWNVDHIHSNLNKWERKAIVRRVKNGETNILLSYGIGVEGFDVPGLWGIIWFRFTESLAIWIQFNARAARILEGKKNYILVDPMGNITIHGRPDIDRNWKLDTDYIPGQDVSDAPESKFCPVCKVGNNIDNNNCWICNYDFITGLLDGEEIDKKKRKLPKIIDGELVYLDGGYDGQQGTENINNNFNGNSAISSNKSQTSNDGSMHGDKKSDRESGNIVAPTKAEKVKILTGNLTGLKSKTKFKEGIKWL